MSEQTPTANDSSCVACGRHVDRTIPTPIPDGYECMWSEAMCGRALYCTACYSEGRPVSEQPTPADLTAILTKHAPTFTEMAHDPTTTFYCKSCSEAAGDWVTWTPEHLAEQITAAGFGPERDEVARGVRCPSGEPGACLSYRCGSNCSRDYDRMHPCMACVIHERRQAEAREKALRESVEALADEWETNAGDQSEAWRVYGPQVVSVPFAVDSCRALLATSPDREGGAS